MKDEFVMVPRAELERLQESMDPHRGAVAWGIVCDLLAAPAAQYQGEPVAWRYKTRVFVQALGYVWREVIETEEPDLTEVAARDLTPLYTHADPGEVERLRDQVKSLEVELKAVTDEHDESLRKLAERDTLLREVRETLQKEYWDQYAGLDETRDLIDAALSDSAEPSAPVERDERAEFEAWYIRDVGPGLANLSRTNTGGQAYVAEDAMSAWEGWLARAALERKP